MIIFPQYRIVIVGNGFDISQGLKTSYADFILAYFKNVYITAIQKGIYEDDFLELDLEATGYTYSGVIAKVEACTELKLLIGSRFRKVYENVNYKGRAGSIFKQMIDKHQNTIKWIDIEKYYYKELKNWSIEGELFLDEVKYLNEFMRIISFKLEKYLENIQIKFYRNNSVSFESIKPYFKNIDPVEGENSTNAVDTRELKKLLFLNFNYTNILSTMSIEAEALGYDVEVINIHGEIGDRNNPIIFGYGDDTSDDYKKLEVADEDDLLINIKSFKYPRTDNYHKVLDFVENVGNSHGSNVVFDVVIAGHSCGLSDKTLLKTIFEDDLCKSITAYHYKKDEEEAYNEHFYKGIAVSRHFSNKPEFRKRFQNFNPNAKIIQKVILEEDDENVTS